MYSLIIPVFRNEGSIPELLAQLRALHRGLEGKLEVVFVDDGGPDRSAAILRDELPAQPFASKLLAHSRNFGSFAAIRSGLREASGPYFAVMAADLQEPTSLAGEFFQVLAKGEADVVIGRREARDDPFFSSLASRLFWSTYRLLIQPDVPKGGIDVFGCNLACRDQLLALDESNSSLVGLLLWIGFRRALVPYTRLPRRHGKSAWSFSRKLRYMMDSLYAFSDLPVRLLVRGGAMSIAFAALFGAIVLVERLRGAIPVPGYTVVVLMIMFFGGLNSLGLGIVGGYVWRAYENTKRRPNAIVMSQLSFPARPTTEQSRPSGERVIDRPAFDEPTVIDAPPETAFETTRTELRWSTSSIPEAFASPSRSARARASGRSRTCCPRRRSGATATCATTSSSRST